MNTLVLLRMVPDVVEELEIAPDGKRLDTEYLRMILSESDDHALEEAVLLKERYGGTVTVLATAAPDVDDALFAGLAKGVDRVMKIAGTEEALSAREAAHVFASALQREPGLLPADLILTGVQAIDDLDALVAPLVARQLKMPYLGIVTQVTVDAGAKVATVLKEYSGGVRGEFEVSLPAVLGIQAAEKPPRYVPVAKVRAVMKTSRIDSIAAPELPATSRSLLEVIEMKKPEATSHAEMLEGTPEAVSGKLVGILSERGLL
jgi:electron transfer flavoprotein beta subunit